MNTRNDQRIRRFDLEHQCECSQCRDDAVRMLFELRDSCPYGNAFRDVRIEWNEGIVYLQGRVNSFYLKQVLQAFIGKFDEVKQVVNDVDVVCSTGLSSVRPE